MRIGGISGMSVVYRAIWSDEPSSDTERLVAGLKTRVAGWAQESPDPVAFVEGQSEWDVSQGRHRNVVHRAIGSDAFEVTVTDQVPGDPTEWVTVIRVVADSTGVHTLVELSMSSDDLTVRVSVGRPRVVHELIEAAGKPKLAGSGLLSGPQAIPAAGITILTDLLADPERSLPTIVCSEPSGQHDGAWKRRAAKIAARAEGVAVVITLDQDAVTLFKRAFGDLAIWGGGIRVYAPGSVTKDSGGWRHRYYLRSRLDEATQAMIDRIVYSVAQLSARRRVPEVFRVFGEQGGRPTDALDGMISATDLTAERERWEFALELARDEQSAVEKELASANGHLARLKEALIVQGLTDLLWGTKHEAAASMPDEVQYTSEAVMAAQMYLSEWLALPDSAIQELEDIDTVPEAYNWGNKTWRGLRALAAYAEDRAGGWDKGVSGIGARRVHCSAGRRPVRSYR